MAFPVEKKLELSYLGSGWDTGAYISFTALTFKEQEKLATLTGEDESSDNKPDPAQSAKEIKDILINHLVSGKAWNGSELVELTEDNIDDLPAEVVTRCIETIVGTPSPN